MSVKFVAIILAVIISAVLASPAKKNNYIEQENSCRQVCGLCDCDGFYCEDECICECNLEEDGNLQCIADMKKECDANGLEYELLMQESTKERFLREVQGDNLDLNKHIVVLKQKRTASAVAHSTLALDDIGHSSAVVAPVVSPVVSSAAAVAPVVAPVVTPAVTNTLGLPFSNLLHGIHGRSGITGSDLGASRILILIRERLDNLKTQLAASAVSAAAVATPIIPPIAAPVIPPVVAAPIAPIVAPVLPKLTMPHLTLPHFDHSNAS